MVVGNIPEQRRYVGDTVMYKMRDKMNELLADMGDKMQQQSDATPPRRITEIPKLIELTTRKGEKVSINPEAIAAIIPRASYGLCRIILKGGAEIHVTQSYEEIIDILKW